MARLVVSSVLFLFQIASSACERASIPESREMTQGAPRHRQGSLIATLAKTSGPKNECLRCFAKSQMVAVGVTSLPVPAVVAANNKGIFGKDSSSIDTSRCLLNQATPSGL